MKQIALVILLTVIAFLLYWHADGRRRPARVVVAPPPPAAAAPAAANAPAEDGADGGEEEEEEDGEEDEEDEEDEEEEDGAVPPVDYAAIQQKQKQLLRDLRATEKNVRRGNYSTLPVLTAELPDGESLLAVRLRLLQYVSVAAAIGKRKAVLLDCRNQMSPEDFLPDQLKKDCSVCRGTGKQRCGVCRNTGLCPQCGGRGYRTRDAFVRRPRFRDGYWHSRESFGFARETVNCRRDCPVCRGNPSSCRQCGGDGRVADREALLSAKRGLYRALTAMLKRRIQAIGRKLREQDGEETETGNAAE